MCGTALMIRLARGGEAWPPPWFSSLTLMFQREVAERIVADEREAANYGRLGALCGWRTQARILFDVSPSAFVPPPKFTSSVVQLTPRAEAPALQRQDAGARHAGPPYGQRRKMRSVAEGARRRAGAASGGRRARSDRAGRDGAGGGVRRPLANALGAAR